jgi:hypothetical protein
MRRALPHARRAVLFWLVLGLPGCGSGPSDQPTPDPLGPTPELLSPIGGAQVTSDTPAFTVRNAQGYDQGQATYTFRLTTLSGQREIATAATPAGAGRTSLTFAAALPRGMTLAWSVVAKNSAGAEVASTTTSFRTTSVMCTSGLNPYGKSIVEWFVPACNLRQNIYNDPQDVLGPPDAGGVGPDRFFGILSLGQEGHVTVDMEACAQDLSGNDLRVYQFVAQEPVTLYAAGSPSGPFQLLGYRVPCGTRVPGSQQRRYCDFDLGAAEVQEARYFKIEDGELYPFCPGDTVSEGADIDAIEILHQK